MGKKSGPKPADPVATAGAQTAQNIGTAIAQQHLSNVNQVTPDGSLTYTQTGSYTHHDPLTGKEFEIPTFTATQVLSKAQRRIHRLGNETETNLARIGRDQSSRIGKLLGREINLDGLPDRADGGDVRDVNLDRVGEGPALRKSFDDAGPVTRSYGSDFSDVTCVTGLMKRGVTATKYAKTPAGFAFAGAADGAMYGGLSGAGHAEPGQRMTGAGYDRQAADLEEGDARGAGTVQRPAGAVRPVADGGQPRSGDVALIR